MNAFRKDHGTLAELSRLFSAHPHELPRLSEKLMGERSALLREKKHLEEQILTLEAQELLTGAEEAEGIRIVLRSYEDRKVESLKVLAQKVAAAPGTLAILYLVQESAQVVLARSASIAGDSGAAIKQLTARLGGRGGGRPELAQAGGIAPDKTDLWAKGLVEYFRNAK